MSNAQSPNPSSSPNNIASRTEQLLVDKNAYRGVPLSTKERQPVYQYVNIWVQQHGLDAFCTKQWTREEFIFLTNEINQANTAYHKDAAPRPSLMTKIEIKRLYEGRLSPLGKLKKRSQGLKSSIDKGQLVKDSERFPEMAIFLATAGDDPMVVENSKNNDAKSSVEIQTETDTSGMPAAKKQRKVVQLSVDWTRLQIGGNDIMAVLQKAEAQAETVTSERAQEDVLDEEGSECMSISEGEEGATF